MAESQKWWFDAAASEQESSTSSSQSAGSGGVNIGALMSSAQQLVEWASELVLAPHAEHDDPAEHAECLICRGQQLLTSPLVQSAVANAAAGAVQFAAAPRVPQFGGNPDASQGTRSPQRSLRLIEWIPVERLPAQRGRT